ncbi:hypothetical protein [Paenibacillus alginolyticus]|uniref:Uncharacterized protein n=1 Tax=Paenibacillus alginolyticus TaxID=59839 RepID=A0ABT4GL50_9BACL|nr:hypothetical protein [Paenibacillus alginolyticus]MCY9696935.1 hypothetical protein [Paenibacillus alginolyticus]MEC0145799.1 hypothetical protein [Paenibacillus alginolyticus]
MSDKIISDEELMLLLSPTNNNEENEPSEKPRLTMKLLYELIKKLKQENMLLSKRVDDLEQQLDMLHQVREEVATTLDLPMIKEPEITVGMEAELVSGLPQTILTSRAERHPSKKNRFFWTYLLSHLTNFHFN